MIDCSSISLQSKDDIGALHFGHLAKTFGLKAPSKFGDLVGPVFEREARVKFSS